MPERVIFVHVQHARQSDLSAHSLVALQHLAGEQQLVFVFKQVRDIAVFLFLSKTALAAVSAAELASAGKAVDRQTALVGAALTFCHVCGKLQAVDFLNRKHGRLFAGFEALTRDQSSAESAHDAGDIGTDRFAVCDALEAAQHRVIVEGAALHDNVLSELGGVGNLNYLI